MDYPINNCQNCGNELMETQRFCMSCGQETKLSKLTVKELFINVFHTIFNFDNTFFNTVKIIFRPWEYTTQYIAGKRKMYMNPIRIFIILMLVYIGLLISNLHIDNVPLKKVMEIETDFLNTFNQSISTFDLDAQDCNQLDTLKRTVFPNVYMLEDTTSANVTELVLSDYKISRYDAIYLTPDEIAKKYNITSFLKKRFLTQYLKIKDQQEGGIKFAISNIVWGMCGAIFLLAGLFKLLYFRSKRFYIEHIILILNVHVVAIFIGVILALVSKLFEDLGNDYIALSLLAALLAFIIYMFLSLYFYYKQPLWKTLLKYFFILFNYVSFGFLVILIFSIVSLIFY